MSEVIHHPKVVRGLDVDGTRCYRLECSCGAAGEAQAARRLAVLDEREHIASLPPVPESQQCRDPKRHRVRHWEQCGLCADQTSLFDL